MAKERETLKDELDRNEGGSSVPQVVKMASAQWKQMSEEDKAPYDAASLHFQTATHIGVQHGVLPDSSEPPPKKERTYSTRKGQTFACGHLWKLFQTQCTRWDFSK